MKSQAKSKFFSKRRTLISLMLVLVIQLAVFWVCLTCGPAPWDVHRHPSSMSILTISTPTPGD